MTIACFYTPGGNKLLAGSSDFTRWVAMPYGRWTCQDGRQVLFNRFYEPIWQRYPDGPVAPANPTERVNYVTTDYHYRSGTPEGQKRLHAAAVLLDWGLSVPTWQTLKGAYAKHRRWSGAVDMIPNASIRQEPPALDAGRFPLPQTWKAVCDCHSLTPRNYGASIARYHKAVADELLPALLGGWWIPTDTGVPDGNHYNGGGIFDHSQWFRRKGSRGVLTWQHAVRLCEPYDALGKDTILREAAELATTRGLSVIGSRLWSGWYPGWTHMILIGAGLPVDRANQLGFKVLASPG